MATTKILGVRQRPERRAAFEGLARRLGKRKAATLARQVLEEFLACFLSDAELAELGMQEYKSRGGGLLRVAQESAQEKESHERSPKRKRSA